MIMPIQLLKLSAVNKEGSESVLIHCLFYIAMRSEEAAGGRLCRSISHKSILPNLLYERDVTSTIIPPMINNGKTDGRCAPQSGRSKTHLRSPEGAKCNSSVSE